MARYNGFIMKKVDNLVGEAKNLLKKKAYDAIHSVDHHCRVWKNCLEIIKGEGLKPDKQTLMIAAWWHGYNRGNENDFSYLEDISNKYKVDIAFEKKVINIIKHHSFGTKQDTLESKILI